MESLKCDMGCGKDHNYGDPNKATEGEVCGTLWCNGRLRSPALPQGDGCNVPLESPEMILSADSIARKETPITTGVLDYFPLALAAVARLSKKGNDKHNPGQPLHWSRGKSVDHADCIPRHLIDRGSVDPESGELHEVSLAWRALALLELAEETRLGKGPPRGAR